MMRVQRLLHLWIAIVTSFTLLASFAAAQDPDASLRLHRKDDPAGREQWFRRGRQTRNGQPAAKMLHQAYQSKMKMRVAREKKIRSLIAAHKPLTVDVAPTVGVWNNLGPRPIVDNSVTPNGYGPLAGRVTALAVDQSDATGNTVLAGGAYGGVWRSTNAAASDPNAVEWAPLIDDQPTLAVGAIALQPDNSNVVLVGTGEPNYAGDSYFGVGILRSTDGGSSWTTIASTTDGFSLYGAGVAQFAFSTKNPNLVMAATSFAVVWPTASSGNSVAGTILSTDAGASWITVPFTNDNANYYTATASAVVYNPKQDKFYAAIPFLGVYVSNTTASAGITSFVRLKNQPGASGALSASKCSLSNYGSGACPILRGAMSVRPVTSASDPDQMYIWFVADGNGDASDDQGIWRSSTDTSGNVTWSSVSDSGITSCGDSYGCGTTQSFYNLYISAVPHGSSTDLYAGTINIFKSNVSCTGSSCTASTFKNLTHVYGCSSISGVHPDQHALDFLVSNPNIMYFGDDGGVNRTLSSTTNLNTGTCPSGNTQANAFDNLNNHIGALTQFTWGTNHPTDPTTLMGGSQDNGTMAVSASLPSGGDAGWWEVNAGDGGYNWIDPKNPTNWYSAYTGVSVQYCTNTINCNTATFLPIIEEDLDQGTVHQVDNDLSNFYTPYMLDPAKPTQILVGTCRVWRGGNSASAWPSNSSANALSHQLGGTSDTACGPTSDPIQALAAGGPVNSKGTSSVIYAGTSGGHVYMTSNANTGVATWTEVTGSINPNLFPISTLAVDQSDPTGNTVWLGIQGFMNGVGGHVFRSTTAGNSWIDYSTTLPDLPVNDIAVDPSNSSEIYVATDAGVFMSQANDLGYWNEIGPTTSPGYLPNVPVLHIAVYRNGADERLRAWTHGRGVWETALAQPDLTITPSYLYSETPLGTPVVQKISLRNNTAAGITLGTPTISFDTTNQFSISSETTCGTSLGSNKTCVFAVQYSATVAGTASAYLNFTTSSSQFGSNVINLGGNATTSATDFSFNFGANETSQTISAGGTAVYPFNLDAIPDGSSNFNPAVSLTCSVPASASKTSCSFVANSLSAPGQTQLNIATTAPTTTSAQRSAAPSRRDPTMFGAFSLPVLGLLVVPIARTRSRRKRILMFSAMMVIAASLVSLAACGGGGGSKPISTGPTTVPGTPPGTYTITITGTYGSTTHTQNVTLVVQ